MLQAVHAPLLSVHRAFHQQVGGQRSTVQRSRQTADQLTGQSISSVKVEDDEFCTSFEHASTSAKPSAMLLHRRHLLTGAAALATLRTTRQADAKTTSSGGDWSSPGLASVEDDSAPRFMKTASGVKIQELRVGSGTAATAGDRVLIEYVLRRANGYFIYRETRVPQQQVALLCNLRADFIPCSTVEGVSFQPRSVETGPVVLTLGDGLNIKGLEEAIEGMQPAGKRRVLVPPQLGYTNVDLLPQPPGFAAKRQVINHASEGLIFEVQLVRIRDAA